MELKPVKIGKKMKLKYIPFSELIIPWEVCIDSNAKPENDFYKTGQIDVFTYGTLAPDSSKPLKTMKRNDLEDLKYSIGRFGLLKPFEVAEMPEQLDFFYGKGKYVIIDGQRRYLAIRELLRLPTENDERKEKDNLETHSGYEGISKAEMQAQEQYKKLSIRDYLLVPCLIYPYRTYLQMMRHEIEDHKFSVKPSDSHYEIAERMHQQGIPDLSADDFGELWETRSKIGQEKQAIAKTLQEIRDKLKEGKIEDNRRLEETKSRRLLQ